LSRPGDRLWRARRALFIFGLALALRVMFVLLINSGVVAVQTDLTVPRFANDSLMYDALAGSVASGEGYQVNGDQRTVSSIPPLFPIFLAGLYKLFGGRPSILVLGLVNAVLGALTSVLLYKLTRICFSVESTARGATGFSEQVALVAALMFAVYPFLIFNTPYVIKETFATTLTVGFALAWVCMLRARAKRVFGWAVVAGALAGLSALSRFPHTGLMFVFVLVNWCVARQRRKSLTMANVLALVVFSLVLTPWLVRNYYVLGRVTLSNHGPSRYLYNANSDFAEPETSGDYRARGEGRAAHNVRVDGATGHDVYANEGTYFRDALGAIIYRPGHALLLTAAKLVNMWRPVWAGSSLRTWLVLGVPYLLMMMLALPGLWLARRRNAHATLSIIVPYAFIIFYFLGHALFYGMIRERQYAEPFLIMFAGYSLCLMLKRRRPDGSKRKGDL